MFPRFLNSQPRDDSPAPEIQSGQKEAEETPPANFEMPKATWNTIEPLDQSDATPHEINAEMKTRDGWGIAGASARGKLHAHRGLWREDSLAFAEVQTRNFESLWSCVAVSDGAGSAPLSRVGAQIVVESVLSTLKSSLETFGALWIDGNDSVQEVLVEAAKNALDDLRDEAQKRQKPLGDFAATLLILVRREWQNGQLCASLQVGDGAIALYHDDETLTLLGEADHGEHSSETRFLTTSGVENSLSERVKFEIVPNLRAFAVMTDGVSDDFFPENPRLGEIFKALLPVLENEEDGGEKVLNWLGYEKKGSSDDRTLVLSWRASNGENA